MAVSSACAGWAAPSVPNAASAMSAARDAAAAMLAVNAETARRRRAMGRSSVAMIVRRCEFTAFLQGGEKGVEAKRRAAWSCSVRSGEADASGALDGFAWFLPHRRRVAHMRVRKRRYAVISGD